MAEQYIFVGCAQGRFETKDGTKQEFANMFVVAPVSDFKSEDYSAEGYKAEKLKCVSPDVWKGLKPGDHVCLFFDSKKRVSYVTPVATE